MPAVAMPSMSLGPIPASFIALSAASAWSPICDKFGMRPSSVVSAAPIMAIDFGFICASSALRRAEQRQGDLVVHLLEGDLDRHVENEGLRRLRALDDVGHQARPLIELDDGDRVGRRETGHWPVVDHIAIEPPFAARAEHADLARGAMRAEWARREINLPAGIAALQAQFAGPCPFPEMHRLGRRLRPGALSLGHRSHLS